MNIEESEKVENSNAIENETFSTEDYFDEANQKLIEFVTKNLEKWKCHLLQEYNNFDKINQALIEHPSIAFSLNVLYQRTRFDVEKAQQAYDNFLAQSYMQMKEEFNRSDNKKEWYSVKELEYQARNRYRNTYDKLKARLAMAEGRKSFVQRALDEWCSYQFVLQQIAKNLISEAEASKLDYRNLSRMPSTPED